MCERNLWLDFWTDVFACDRILTLRHTHINIYRENTISDEDPHVIMIYTDTDTNNNLVCMDENPI